MGQRGVNKAIVVGNLGGEPETRYSQAGEMIVNISVATSEVWKDKATGQPMEKTEWHRIVAFGPLAEIVAQYCTKGTKVYCEGALQTRKWIDDQGVERYTTQIKLQQFEVLAGGVNFDQGAQPSQRAPQPRQAPQQRQASGGTARQAYQRQGGAPAGARMNPNGTQQSPYANTPPANYTPPPGGGFDDDIPF